MDQKKLDQQSQHWEFRFSNNAEMFGLEPSLAAVKALKSFQEKNIKSIVELGAGLGRDTMFFAKNLMNESGYFISKIFMGGTFNEIVAEGKKYFKEVKVFKPKSSRKDSKESFIICRKIR